MSSNEAVQSASALLCAVFSMRSRPGNAFSMAPRPMTQAAKRTITRLTLGAVIVAPELDPRNSVGCTLPLKRQPVFGHGCERDVRDARGTHAGLAAARRTVRCGVCTPLKLALP